MIVPLNANPGNALPSWRLEQYVGRQPISNGLLVGLIEFWPLSEQASTRLGASAGLNLTDNAGVLGATGIDSNASTFVRASSQFLSRTSSAAIQPSASTGFEFCLWARVTSLANNQSMLCKDAVAAGGNRQFALFALSTSGFLYCEVHETTGTTPISFASTLAMSLSTWQMVNFWYDPSDKKARLALNNGSVQASSALSGTFNVTGTNALQIGARSADPNYWQGDLNRIGYWSRILTADERTYLYNGARGRDYPFV